MKDYDFSRYGGSEFMSCLLFFEVIETYIKASYQKPVYELLEICSETWREYKCDRRLPLKHYKKLCWFLGVQETDDDRELVRIITDKYFDEKENYNGE